MYTNHILNISKISLVVICLLQTYTGALKAQLAYSTTWVGGVSTNMNTAGNWDSGGPGRDVEFIFNDPGAATFQPEVPVGAPNNRVEVNAITFNQAGWDITTDAPTNTHVVFWANGVTPYIVSNGSGTNRIGSLRTANGIGPITTGTGNTLEIGGSVGAITVNTKLGNGTLVFGTDALIDDIPDITAGTLLVNSTSSRNGASTKTIANGAVLGGTGGLGHQRSNPVYAFENGATLAPGAKGIGDDTAGTLTFYSVTGNGPGGTFNVDLQTGSTLAIDLFADGTSDKLLFTGEKLKTTLTIGSGVTLALSGTAAYNTPYTLAEFILKGEYVSSYGSFDTITLNGTELTDGVDYIFDYNEHLVDAAGSGSFQLTLIPEPSSILLMLGAFGLFGLLSCRNRG